MAAEMAELLYSASAGSLLGTVLLLAAGAIYCRGAASSVGWAGAAAAADVDEKTKLRHQLGALLLRRVSWQRQQRCWRVAG